MIEALSSREAWTYKAVFDGYDFSKSVVGGEMLNRLMVEYCLSHCVQTVEFDLEQFVADCVSERRKSEPEHRVPQNLRDKYELGKFITSPDSCFDNPYILFNKEKLSFWDGDGLSTWGIEFLVCPSRDSEGNINEIGFRISDTQRVLNAFKWLFLKGAQATYGLHNVSGDSVVLVEGCFDQLALAESGVQNVVGLGSVYYNNEHRKYLDAYKKTWCTDQDAFGLASRNDKESYCFFAPDGKDPFDAWLSSGSVRLVSVE